ncbi:alpha/beta fold hydrolase BchO [Pararhodospirillum photometricum]|uniref:Magnesium-chelatase 30 kDa subunit n=1 Tax=Pararhodospirillum photometricum DSM 122 TaxID=1150469 RepID=H6SIH7_PARPM|nr:alpha/beta fold hydrolase BchO [Pararhodospirillum photometricum]CCG06743.1 Magnesium-chelatase 30 kDa subunit [Pararhodospirillum photometricum DSM 122]
MTARRRLDWARDGREWPHRATSSFVTAAGLRWHVQRTGHGPSLLLLHGTGASTHSWRDLVPALSQHFSLVIPDLPGHAFTDSLPLYRLSLPGMAQAVAGLLRVLDVSPALIVGHSAGAAVALRMVLDGAVRPQGVISLNGALKPYGGAAGQVFSSMAKVLFANPFVPWMAAWTAGGGARTEQVIENTGSSLTPEGLAYYKRLFRAPSHVGGALGMMAGWDLTGLNRDLPRLTVPLLLVAAERDQAVAPAQAERVAKLVSGARALLLKGVGHLAHEERPQETIDLILAEGRRLGLLGEKGKAGDPLM